MVAVQTGAIALETFLKLPNIDESPAWEYVNGAAYQKPMPKTRHSLLQKRLLSQIDRHSETQTALPELRCTFGGRSIAPDISVIAWNRIPLNEAGEPEDNFNAAPDWAIEILSPQQSTTRVLDNLLHCLKNRCQLGWMIDPAEYSILTLLPNQAPQVCRGERPPIVLKGVNLSVTAQQVFDWLKVKR
ncbi:MAG: Uma2 family endonuclease [Cyanobacteria bacterium P01_F01_bin.150]